MPAYQLVHYSFPPFYSVKYQPRPKPLSEGTIVVIAFVVLKTVIILAVCYYMHRKKRLSQATHSEAPQAPMLQELRPTQPTQSLGERLMEEGAPPAYDDAINYPLSPSYDAI